MLVILVAHHAEGNALIEHYNLNQDHQDKSGRRFLGEEVCLRIIGQGETNARQSVIKELAAVSHPGNLHWLNIGIAGSAEWRAGSLVEVKQISSDQTTDNALSFTLHQRKLAPPSVCLSVAEPTETYPQSGVVDMESYAIAAELSARSMLNSLTVVKLVADGPENPLNTLNLSDIRRLLDRSRIHIIGISDKLKRLIATSF
ncbi:MAG: hypothetical protein KTR18_11430 [Acidiferrobacterales bacterium]|nr:hypothetical protein [Acidiferrobacterales bacterium]